MTDNRRFGAFSSSVNPNELAKTIEGTIKAAAGLLAFVGLSAVTGEVNSLAEQVSQLVTLGYSFYGIAETAFGLIRKIVVAAKERF